ncbi:HU family DNA-binding protein [Aureispira anguillae]|uniref:HU family DNA-binding protein n=1 Tax=Aureispira anguillae TaxID=2864201 RepID=A0A916DT39_9BACT|nr:HU family DNA-binding protein [Aureispira anguillae]BDS12954.1 HU family DNA-binding protein [Aureispira anguillae]
MNKGDLIDKIAEKAGLKKADAAAALDATLESIKDALKDGDKVTLVGFCTLNTSYRAARKGVNPSTNKPVQIPEKVTVKFKAGKLLSDSVNTSALKKALKPKK